MALSNDLISQFVKATLDKEQTNKESTAYGTIVKQGDTEYVKLDGSDLLTPIDSTTVVKNGDRVMVTIKNHTAIVTGDFTNKSANDSEVKEIGSKISEFEIVIADKVTTEQLEAEIAKIDKLIADNIEAVNGKFETIEGKVAEIDTIKADVIEVEGKITAHEGEFTTIRGEIAEFEDLTTGSIEAIEGEFHNLESDYATFKETTTNKITANEGSIKELETEKLDVESAKIIYANIDFSNIGEAAIQKLFTESGIIKDLIMSDGKVTGELVGVTIKGDLIEGNTVKADKLVILGEDGIYYKLNVNALGETTASSDEKYQNGLDGSVIIAKSITADRVAVTDLVAFGATIGGYQIKDHSLYSGVKDSATNSTRGVFLGDDGQFAVGDSSNYLKFFKDEDGNFKLEIKASEILLGTSGKTIEEAISDVENSLNNIQVGGRNLLLDSDTLPYEGLCVRNGYKIERTVVDDIEAISGKHVEYKIVHLEGWGPYGYDFAIQIFDNLTEKFNTSLLDKKFTISFEIKSNKDLDIKLQPGYTSYDEGFPSTSINTEWQKYTYIWTITEDNYAPYFFFCGSYDSGDIIYIRDFKVEEGTVATTWTPAPEDTKQVDIQVGGRNLLLDSEIGYPFTHSHNPNVPETDDQFTDPNITDVSEAEDKKVTILENKQGSQYCSINDKITPLNEIVLKDVDSTVFALDTKVTGNFENLKFNLDISLENNNSIKTSVPISNDVNKDEWNRFYIVSKVAKNKSIQLLNVNDVYEQTKSITGTLTVDEDGWINISAAGMMSASFSEILFKCPNLKTSTQYALIIEYGNGIGTSTTFSCLSKIDKTNIIDGGTMATVIGQRHTYFSTGSLIRNGSKSIDIITTPDEFKDGVEPNIGFRLYSQAMGNGDLTFRATLIEDISINEDEFVYKPYGETNTNALLSVEWDGADVGSTVEYRLPKLELGTVATTWTPAPEDIDSNIDDAKNSINEVKDDLTTNYYTKTETDAQIKIQSDRITSTVTKVETVEKSAVISSVEEFYLSSSPTALYGGSWSTTQPVWSEGKYIWRRNLVTKGDGSTSYQPSQNGVCITGNTGNTGPQGPQGDPGKDGTNGQPGQDGKGIVNTTVTYQASTSGTTIPTGEWLTSIPAVDAGSFLWTRTVTTYTSGNPTTAYSVGKMGETGADGKQGEDGQPGTDGRGIKSTSNTYQTSSSGTTIPTGEWLTSIPKTTADKPYLWTRIVITYTDNTTSTSYSVGSTPEGITVGGRNLALGTNNGIEGWAYNRENGDATKTDYLDDDGVNGVILDCITASTGWQFISYNNNFKNQLKLLKENTIYTLSCDIKSNMGALEAAFAIMTGSAKNRLCEDNVQMIKGDETWEKLVFTIKTINDFSTVEISDQILYFRGFKKVGYVIFKNLKLEEGNKPTSWTPAPEDVSNNISNIENNINGRLEDINTNIQTAQSTITQLSNMISHLITDENGGSLMTQTPDGWTFNMSSINGNLEAIQEAMENMHDEHGETNSALEKLTDLVNDVANKTAYITMSTDDNGDPCIELGKSDSLFKVRITNTAIDFLEGSTKIAYANNKTFYSDTIIVKNELHVIREYRVEDGSSPNETDFEIGFIWKVRANGNMGLIPIGSDENFVHSGGSN